MSDKIDLREIERWCDADDLSPAGMPTWKLRALVAAVRAFKEWWDDPEPEEEQAVYDILCRFTDREADRE